VAAACIGIAFLLRVSPLGSFFYPTEPFILAVLAAAWFGGVGPGVFAALLSAVTVPQLIAITQLPSTEYRLFWGFFDLPRFITLGLTGAAMGWGMSAHRRAATALRERERELTKARDVLETAVAERTAHLAASEERYALAIRASGAGHWDWKIASDEFYASPRYLEFAGFPPDMRYSTRDEIVSRIPFHPDDRAAYEAAVQAHFAGETPRLDVVIRVVPHGQVRWLHVIGMCSRDEDGKPTRWAGSVTDITERRRVEEALRQSEERYALAVDGASQGIFDWDLANDRVFHSRRAQEFLGIEVGEARRARREWAAMIRYHPEDLPRIRDSIRRSLNAEKPMCDDEYRVVTRKGEVRWLRQRGVVLRDAAGKAYRMAGSIEDVTERKLAAQALRESETRFRALTALWSDWYWQQDEELRFSFSSAGSDWPDGSMRSSPIGMRRWEIPAVVPLSSSWAEHQEVLAARKPFRDFEYCQSSSDGTIRYVSSSGTPVYDDKGQFRGYQGVARDITERKRFEEELRSRKEMLELALKSARAVPWQWINGADPEVNKWSPELCAMFGLPPGGFDGTAEGWWKLCHPDDCARIKSAITDAVTTGQVDVEYRVTHSDGKLRWLNQKGRAFLDVNGKPLRSIGFMFDVTERRKVEEDLRSRQEMLELAQKSARAIAFEWKIGDGEGENRWSPDLEAMYGFAPGTYDGTFQSWRKRVHPDDWAGVKQAIQHAERTGEVASEYRVVHPDGSAHWLQARGRMFSDPAGKPARVVGFMQDVTQRKQAEEDMRQLEEKLRRAQRLESMGTLAGGIAHDFNNILGAIVGYGEMALRDAKKGTRLRRDLDAIMAAGERGRALVDRILAFSRSGVGERVPVHVEDVVREALDQLGAKLPLNVTIAPCLRAGHAAMLGDSTQVHQVVMNLVYNGVQAMPKGGVLRVCLESLAIGTPRAALIGAVSAGEYIVLKVADSGSGIAPDVLERMFDPFFTTKEVGVGSGLGLSLVHGIVASVGGAIDVVTDLGKGTAFTVYLPRSGDAPAKRLDENLPLLRGDGQRVLVVDDEEPLVRLATETLERLGYAAVGFTSSSAALAAFRADPQRFDAVLTDERMPGMSGTTLIREVRGIRDSIPVVLMSGYLGATPRDMHDTSVADALGVVPRVPVGVGADVVVEKPLSAGDLAASMARALGQ
jgi:PAS domain S-box-containing protein